MSRREGVRYVALSISETVDGVILHVQRMLDGGTYDWPKSRAALERTLADLEAQSAGDPGIERLRRFIANGQEVWETRHRDGYWFRRRPRFGAEIERVAKLKVEAADNLKQLHTHHDRLETNRGRALAALSVLKGQADSAPDDRAKSAIITKAQFVAREIQTLDTDLGHDEESMATVGNWLSEITKALDDAAQRLADARRNLADAQREMRRADQEQQLTQRTPDRQKQLSDITRASDSLGVALGAMRNAAAGAH